MTYGQYYLSNEPFRWPDERQNFRALVARTLVKLLITAKEIQAGKKFSVTRFKPVVLLFSSKHYKPFMENSHNLSKTSIIADLRYRY